MSPPYFLHHILFGREIGHGIYCPRHYVITIILCNKLSVEKLYSSYPWKIWIASFGTSKSFNSFDVFLLKPSGPHRRTRGCAPKEATQGAKISLLILPFVPDHSSSSDRICSTLTNVNFSRSSLQGISRSFWLKKSNLAGWRDGGI